MAIASPSLSSRERVLAEALALPADDRPQVAAELLASLDDSSTSAADDTWVAEVLARAERSHRGESRAQSWENVKRDVLARLRRR